MIVAMKHEKRRFVEKVDFITSPGFIDGGDSRAKSGLISGGMWRVVTDLALLGFHARSREMCVLALHPGVTAEQVQDSTGFDLHIDKRTERTAPPHENELAVLRELDPERHTEQIPLTSRIVRQLRDEVAARGGELLFVAIPSKRQFRHEAGFTPYQRQMETLCGRLGVPYLDLAPALEGSVLRTYFRIGDHWNGHGNKVVAQALLEHLEARTKLVLGPDD